MCTMGYLSRMIHHENHKKPEWSQNPLQRDALKSLYLVHYWEALGCHY